MKFDCGETWKEEKARLGEWHKFFCIFPRRVGDHDCRWLEYIERKGEYICGYDGGRWEWEYRVPK